MSFSVLMSVYKKENPAYLAEALKSVFEQTLPPDEVVLIEDGPLTEQLREIIEIYQKKYSNLVTFQFKENVQLGRALAKGVELCSNELIARMDTDDVALPDRFEKQCAYMEAHPKTAVCGGWMQEFDDAGAYHRQKQMPEENNKIRAYARYRNPVNHMTVMFRKSEVLRAGNYRHFPLLEDYDLWCRMLMLDMEFYNLPEVLVNMRNNASVYGRRGGFDYFRKYAGFRRQQYQMGWLTGGQYLTALLLTLGITMQPAFLRKLVYRRVLRK